MIRINYTQSPTQFKKVGWGGMLRKEEEEGGFGAVHVEWWCEMWKAAGSSWGGAIPVTTPKKMYNFPNLESQRRKQE